MRKIMIKLCEFLEKKLYDEPTYDELMRSLDRTRHRLLDATIEIRYLQSLIKDMVKNR